MQSAVNPFTASQHGDRTWSKTQSQSLKTHSEINQPMREPLTEVTPNGESEKSMSYLYEVVSRIASTERSFEEQVVSVAFLRGFDQLVVLLAVQ